jgi:hypothetical protein
MTIMAKPLDSKEIVANQELVICTMLEIGALKGEGSQSFFE